MKKKQFILFILLSVTFFLVTDNFLFAQTTKDLKYLDSLLNSNTLISFNSYLNKIDTTFIDQKEKAELYSILAKYFDKKEKTELSLIYYKKSEIIFSKIGDLDKQADIQYKIFNLLNSQENFNKKEAKEYIINYINYAKKTSDSIRLLNAYIGLARINFNPANFKKSIKYYNDALSITKNIDDRLTEAKIYSNKAIILNYFMKKSDSALLLLKEARHIYSTLNLNIKIFNSTINISKIYSSKKQFNDALLWLQKADKIPITSFKINSKKLLYQLMATNYDSLHDYKNANIYLKKYLAYKDSVDIKAQNIAISDIQTKYNTAQKEKDIIQLKAVKAKQRSYLIIFAFIFFGSLVVGFLAYQNIKRKRNLAERDRLIEHQKVNSLMKEQELKTLDAIVKGQEKERKRIAEDLHDNLGSKLAILKLQFDSFLDKAEIANNKKQLNAFKNTSSLLEDTYQTVRSMAHSESANSVNQSLVHAVKELAFNISKSKTTNIEVTDFGLDKPISNKIELLSFRIIQELITNTIKYANANNVSIDLTLYDDLLNIIVTDDGKGFNVSKIEAKSKGIGLKSIKKRVLKQNGTFTIDSGLGNGTTIIIELPINQNII